MSVRFTLNGVSSDIMVHFIREYIEENGARVELLPAPNTILLSILFILTGLFASSRVLRTSGQ